MLRTGDQIGPYTLMKKLGRGAFGVVWLAERRTAIAATTVALKIPLDDDVDLETIKQEAMVWVQASGHPNVLPIIEANIYDDMVVIASEYAPDGSLDTWLKRYSGVAPSVESAIEMVYGILAGLEHLHVRHIIHRDLKPPNILLQGETPRLADFGISRVLKTTSQSSIVAGTPAYMAPEAFSGKRTERTDIWSTGVIFYLLLTGHLPFPNTDLASLMRDILTSDPNPLPSSLAQYLQDIIDRALAKNPAQRYQSVADMRKALRNARDSFLQSKTIDQTTIINHAAAAKHQVTTDIKNRKLPPIGINRPLAPDKRQSIQPRRSNITPSPDQVKGSPLVGERKSTPIIKQSSSSNGIETVWVVIASILVIIVLFLFIYLTGI